MGVETPTARASRGRRAVGREEQGGEESHTLGAVHLHERNMAEGFEQIKNNFTGGAIFLSALPLQRIFPFSIASKVDRAIGAGQFAEPAKRVKHFLASSGAVL